MCRTKHQKKNRVRNVEEADYAFAIQENTMSERLTFLVGGVKLTLLIDSGATNNVIDEDTWEDLKQSKIKCKSYVPEAERKLYTYSSNQPLTVKGAFKCEVNISNKTEQAEFIVIRGKGEPLLGRETAIKLGVLKIGADISAVMEIKQALQQKYPEVFSGVGKLNTNQVNLHIDQSVKPVAQPLRRIPFNLRRAVEQRIKELMDMDIIEPVSGPTPWVNPVVIVPKANSEIRLCLDI